MAEQNGGMGQIGGSELEAVLATVTVPQVWVALARWGAVWQGAMAGGDGDDGGDKPSLALACWQLVGHLGALDWQGVPPDRLSKARSLTVEMHRQLMLLQTDLRFLSVTRQAQKRSQLLTQVGDRFNHIGGYCDMAQQYLKGDSLGDSQ